MTRRTLLAGLTAAPFLSQARAANAEIGLAPLALASGWVGTPPSLASLRGRAVLVDIFTFECINCVRVTPGLKQLYARYSRDDLEIVAVHTPEVPSYQTARAYVAREANNAHLPWPIALDNAYRIWNAYDVSAWPTQLIFDPRGHLHATVVGDGQDRAVDAAVAAVVRG